ncbi:unnamed protein product [Orchesella dallaii]|uniref:Uncharacterized protein n=1 Tax=Orchesella dallaii TaxID=48710 RepID=A0ABP1QJQ4_9HEXA
MKERIKLTQSEDGKEMTVIDNCLNWEHSLFVCCPLFDLFCLFCYVDVDLFEAVCTYELEESVERA